MVQKLRLATASPASQPTVPQTLEQLARLARRTGALGADLLLLPEAYLGGYPRGSGFSGVVGSRKDAERDAFLRYFRGAVDLGDGPHVDETVFGGHHCRRDSSNSNSNSGSNPATPGTGYGAGGYGEGNNEGQVGGGGGGVGGGGGGEGGGGERARGDGTREALERIARESGVFLVVGCVERAGGSLYCAALYVCPRLGLVGKRRKVMPTGTERLIWAQGSPRTLRAVSTTIRGVRVNMGVAICWENYMPLLRQALYAQNINLWLAPTADARDAWLSLMRTVGIEGRCFVVSSNMCVREGGGERSGGGQTAVEEGQRTASVGGGGGGGGNGNSVTDTIGKGITATATTAQPKERRNSCLTEDGFEIALPPSKATPTTAEPGTTCTAVDGDGIKISLPEATTPTATTPTTAAGVSGSRPRQKETEPTQRARFSSRGGSSIVSPFGDVLAGPQWEDAEGIIWADVDFDDCIRGRLDYDAAGHYSRNDSFKFSVEGLDLTALPY